MWLPWYRTPARGLAVAIALTIGTAGAGAIPGRVGRIIVVGLLMALAVAQSIVPFAFLVCRGLQGDVRVRRLSLPWLIGYLVVAMQLAHAHVYWLVFVLDEPGAFTNVCGLDIVTESSSCTATGNSWRVVARLVYFSIGTFFTAGLGEIAPNSLAATLLVIPEFYALFFFTALLISRVVVK